MHILSAVEQDRFEQPPKKHSTALLDIIETHTPQSWASFNMLGEFDFSDEKLQDTTGVLPPKSRSKSSPKIGRREINDIYAVSIGYRKSYGRFGTFAPLGPPLGDRSAFSDCLQYSLAMHVYRSRIRILLCFVTLCAGNLIRR